MCILAVDVHTALVRAVYHPSGRNDVQFGISPEMVRHRTGNVHIDRQLRLPRHDDRLRLARHLHLDRFYDCKRRRRLDRPTAVEFDSHR